MERVSKRLKIFITSELKTLLKQCFKNPLYAQVPFEVWLDIVWKADLKSMLTIVSTSTTFKELVDKHLKHDVRFALMCRREDQIPIARKCLKMCAKDGDPTAILHLALATEWGGWGLSKRCILNKTKDWIKKTVENDKYIYIGVMFWLSLNSCPNRDYKEFLKNTSSHKYILICDIGHAVVWKGGIDNRVIRRTTEYLEPFAISGDEFAQLLMGLILSTNRHKSLYWLTKAAEQGNYKSIQHLSFMYSARDENERPLFEKYSYKARMQQNL